ncbi:MAG: regulatory protein RecX [Terracidiphilus sp.]
MKLPFQPKSSKPRVFLNAAGLYEYAVKSLGRSMRSEADLRRLLARRAEPGEPGRALIASVVARLKEMRYLDDQSFAETYVRLRQENEKLGARRVRQDLRQKGVGAGLIDAAVQARYAAVNEETLARAFLERKRLGKPENEKETARLMRRLVAAGFSTGVISKILRQWEVPDEALSALDNLDEGETPGQQSRRE